MEIFCRVREQRLEDCRMVKRSAVRAIHSLASIYMSEIQIEHVGTN